MRCFSYCLGNEFNLNALDNYLKRHARYHITRYRGVIQVELKEQNQLIFFFSNGTLVSWNLNQKDTLYWLELSKPFIQSPLLSYSRDEFSYRISDKTTIKPHRYFNVDCLTLEEDSQELKLSIAYGLSQSIKLNSYELRLERLFQTYTPIIEEVKKVKIKPISRRKIHKIIAEILVEKSELNLVSNFLYQPVFFWQHPTLERYYTLMEEYMDIEKRVTALNQRLDTLNDIFDVLHSYLDNQHGHFLEVIIIVLIAIEIIFNLLNLHF